ncbi:MAG: hypothetical protein M3355_06600, partial [Actinomycetota bacterium]|nr:hypothetical protein [Actinomycetota bacterium]
SLLPDVGGGTQGRWTISVGALDEKHLLSESHRAWTAGTKADGYMVGLGRIQHDGVWFVLPFLGPGSVSLPAK